MGHNLWQYGLGMSVWDPLQHSLKAMKLGHPTAFHKHQIRPVCLIQGSLTHYPGSTDEWWSFTIWISCKINPGIPTDFYFSLLPHSTVMLWQEPVVLDVSHRKYSASSESYFREFVSEQAFGNTGNGGPTFKGKAVRSPSALLVSQLRS